MAEPFLGADGGDDFGFRIEVDAVFAACISSATSLRRPGDSVADAVAVIARIARRPRPVFRRRDSGVGIGGVAHAQVDDVDAGHALVVLHLVDAAEQIRRQAGRCGRKRRF